MTEDIRPQCKFNTNCYRLNPDHLKRWTHSHLDPLLHDFIHDPTFQLTPEKIQRYDIQRPDTVLDQLTVLKDSDSTSPTADTTTTQSSSRTKGSSVGPVPTNESAAPSSMETRSSSVFRTTQSSSRSKGSSVGPVPTNESAAPSSMVTRSMSSVSRPSGASATSSFQSSLNSMTEKLLRKMTSQGATLQSQVTDTKGAFGVKPSKPDADIRPLSQGPPSLAATFAKPARKPPEVGLLPLPSQNATGHDTKPEPFSRPQVSATAQYADESHVAPVRPTDYQGPTDRNRLPAVSRLQTSASARSADESYEASVRPAESPQSQRPHKISKSSIVQDEMSSSLMSTSADVPFVGALKAPHGAIGSTTDSASLQVQTNDSKSVDRPTKLYEDDKSDKTSRNQKSQQDVLKAIRSLKSDGSNRDSGFFSTTRKTSRESEKGKRPSSSPPTSTRGSDVQPNKKMKLGLGSSQPTSKWLKGSLCPVNRKNPNAFFIKPSVGLPEGYNQDKDVFLSPASISRYLLPFQKGDELEFILGDRDKEKPMARKVRIVKYSCRTFEEMIAYLQEFIELLESRDRNQVLVEALPCFALWDLLGSATFQDQVNCCLYVEFLLRLLSQILFVGKLNKTLMEDAVIIVLQGKLFQENNKSGLPAMIKDFRSEEFDSYGGLLAAITSFCRDIAVNVPKSVKTLLPTVSALCGLRPSENTSFVIDLLTAIVSTRGLCLPDMAVWTEMPLIPTTKELAGPLVEEDKHLSPVKTSQPYDGPEDYMDTYFRLLRAETFAAIQRGIKELKASELDPRDMNVYFKVTLAGYEVHNAGFSLALQFKPAKAVTKWEASPQLMFGNLVCISPNRRFDDVIWATVSNRDPKLLASSQIIMVDLIDYNSKSTREIMTSLQVFNGSTVMVESPTYFHSLKPILDSLRDFNMEEFPLHDEIVKATPHSRPPCYIDFAGSLDTSGISTTDTRQDTSAERGCIIGSDMRVQDFLQTFSRSSNTTLEASQCDALVHAMKNRLAIIQGPPGCGKTFLGVKIVQLLLSMTPKLTKPILLLTYKNHALDEFLKAMLAFCDKEDVVRIGGRSKDPELEECNLQAVMRNNKAPKAQFVEIQDARNEVESLTSEIKAKSSALDCSSHLTRESLLAELSDEQVTSLLVDAGWTSRTPSAYRVNSKKYADRQWVSNLLSDIAKHVSIKSILIQCLQTGVPQGNTEAQHCFNLFLQALKLWLPDQKELAKLKTLQAQFIQEMYAIEAESECLDSTETKKKTKKSDAEDDGDYDEEEVAALLESRLSATGGEGRRRMDNLVIFDSVKKKSSDILIHLSDFPPNMESSSNILSVQNLWTLSEIERMKFLHNLLKERSSKITEEFDELLMQLERLKNRKKELETHQKVAVVLSKKIVGVTITGASIHHDLLHHIGPSIVIVEEAAEILEPSLVAALTPNIEHLILIGDHQQLKPQVDTYKLTTKYHFNVSLMERLIRTGFPYKTLKKQNRMRPEFAALLQDIYPDLENNYERLTDNTALTCISKSMFFWTHNDPEKKERTFTNEKEADRVVALVLYLLQNGCKLSEITVLSAYLGQTKLLREKLRKESRGRPELFNNGTSDDFVQVQTIDMFQGDENKYVIVSLVRSNKDGKIGFLKDINRRCVAQSRAKCGMYFVGDVDTLQRRETCWRTLLQEMNKEGCVGRDIPLQCWKHKLSKYPATNAQKVLDVVSNSLKMCNRTCGDQLPCKIAGHVCDKPCSPRHIHPNCFKLVEDEFPACGHKITRKCFEKLFNLRCEKKADVLLKCGHTTEKRCYQKTEDMLCKTMVDYNFPGCRHPSPNKKKCSEEIAWKCWYKVYFKASCGHGVSKACYQKNDEVKCQEACGRKRDCGHPCTNVCGDDCNKGNCKVCEHRFEVFRESARKRKKELEKKLQSGCEEFSKKEIYAGGDTAGAYQKVKDQVDKFIQPMHNWSPSITKIEKVTNLKLEKRFEEAKIRAFGDHIDTKFHGTSKEGVKGITENGFRMPDQNPPPNKRGMYGQGIYFATDSSKSAQDIYTKGSCMLLLCQVILGKTKVVNRSDNTLNKERLRKEKYDSVMAPRGTEVQNDEFVIFDPDQALPQYIIHFSTYTGYRSPSQMLKPSQVAPPTGQPFFKKNVSAARVINPNDPFENYYRLAACHLLTHRQSQTINIQSVDIVINQVLESKFEAKKRDFKRKGIPDGEILAYHGTKKGSIDSILKNNLDWVRYASGQAYGRGNYFSEFPDISIPYGDGLLLCRVLPGKEYVNSGRGNIPPGYNSKKVLLGSHGQAGGGLLAGSNVSGEMVIIEDADQILPYFEMHLK